MIKFEIDNPEIEAKILQLLDRLLAQGDVPAPAPQIIPEITPAQPAQVEEDAEAEEEPKRGKSPALPYCEEGFPRAWKEIAERLIAEHKSFVLNDITLRRDPTRTRLSQWLQTHPQVHSAQINGWNRTLLFSPVKMVGNVKQIAAPPERKTDWPTAGAQGRRQWAPVTQETVEEAMRLNE